MQIKRFICAALSILMLLPCMTVFADGAGEGGEWKAISCGDFNCFAIRNDNSLWSWRYGYDGSSGGGYGYIPMKIMEDVASVSARSTYGVAVKTDDSLWEWGFAGAQDDEDFGARHKPTKVMEDVAVASTHAAIKTDGSLWKWRGRLSYNRAGETKVPVKILDDAVAVSSRLAIKTDGSLWVWGDNEHGQIGDGTVTVVDENREIVVNNNKDFPVKIMEDVAAISHGNLHNLAIKTDGSLWAWGDNEYGQIGDGTITVRGENRKIVVNNDKYKPVKIMDDVVACSAGTVHNLAVKTDGSLWHWGGGVYGNGRGSLTPTKIMDDVAEVSTSMFYSLAFKTDGSLWYWSDEAWDEAIEVMLPSDWAREDVELAANLWRVVPENLLTKYTQTITRAELSSIAALVYHDILWKAEPERRTFSDTNNTDIEEMAGVGVVSGVGDNKFDPDGLVTREQAAVIISRLAEAVGKPLEKQQAAFADTGAISPWALDAADQVRAAGIMVGTEDNNFEPKGYMTREQGIVAISRLYNIIKK